MTLYSTNPRIYVATQNWSLPHNSDCQLHEVVLMHAMSKINRRGFSLLSLMMKLVNVVSSRHQFAHVLFSAINNDLIPVLSLFTIIIIHYLWFCYIKLFSCASVHSLLQE